MTHKAFIVALPVTGPGTTNDISAIVPARFQHVVADGWNIIYSAPAPIMVPHGNDPVQHIEGGKPKWASRTIDNRSVLFLRAIAAHVGQSMAAFVCTSEDPRFLRWVSDSATNAGYETWTRAQLLADNGARATYIKNNATPEDLQAIQKLIAGMDGAAMDTTVASDITTVQSL